MRELPFFNVRVLYHLQFYNEYAAKSMLVFLSGANKLAMGLWLEESVAIPSM